MTVFLVLDDLNDFTFLNQIFYSDLVQPFLLYDILAGNLHLILPATLLKFDNQLNIKNCQLPICRSKQTFFFNSSLYPDSSSFAVRFCSASLSDIFFSLWCLRPIIVKFEWFFMNSTVKLYQRNFLPILLLHLVSRH